MSIICFTDGSAKNNGKLNCRASFSVVWPNNMEFNCAEEIEDFEGIKPSNNRGEYSGAIKALEIADLIDTTREKKLDIYTDSMLLVNTMTKWIANWKRNNWIKSDGNVVLNVDLLKRLLQLTEKRKTSFIYVKAHTKEMSFEAIHNRLADSLAKSAIFT